MAVFACWKPCFCAKNIWKRPFGWIFAARKDAPNRGKSIGTRGFSTCFEAWKRLVFDVICHISRLEILRAATLPMSYLIVNLPFRWNWLTISDSWQFWQFLVLMFQYPLLIYITIYILITYIYYIRGYCHSFFNCQNCQLSDLLITHSLFLYKAKAHDFNQVCVSRSESQVKIQWILNSRF